MAAFDYAYDFTFGSEDPHHNYANVPDPVPIRLADSADIVNLKRAARAISGINSYYFPADFAKINALPQASRGPAIREFYKGHFWNRYLDQVNSDSLAAHVYDASVNQGTPTATKMLQEACNKAAGLSIDDDGDWGPETLRAVNNCDAAVLQEAFRVIRVARYQASNSPNAPAWIARANR